MDNSVVSPVNIVDFFCKNIPDPWQNRKCPVNE